MILDGLETTYLLTSPHHIYSYVLATSQFAIFVLKVNVVSM